MYLGLFISQSLIKTREKKHQGINVNDVENFVKQLNKAQELMSQEKYKEAIVLLEKLKAREKEGDFDYSLTHKLYQLLSNSYSLYNQQIILKALKKVAKKQTFVTFKELLEELIKNEEIDIDEPILKREVELLILRNQMSCKISSDKIEF